MHFFASLTTKILLKLYFLITGEKVHLTFIWKQKLSPLKCQPRTKTLKWIGFHTAVTHTHQTQLLYLRNLEKLCKISVKHIKTVIK